MDVLEGRADGAEVGFAGLDVIADADLWSDVPVVEHPAVAGIHDNPPGETWLTTPETTG